MEVIFIKDLRNQGKKGEIKTVKDGYAENYLIKNGYAVPKTKTNLNKLEHEKKEKEKEDLNNKKKALVLKDQLEKVTLEFKVKTGEQDKVFGSISVKQIKEALAEQNLKVEKSQIDNTTSISTLGFHNVKITLYPDVVATIKVHVIK